MSSLNELVQTEAKKMGVSSKNANKALKMLKKGRIDMSKVAPQIKDMFMKNNPMASVSNLTLREKLQAKLKSKRECRMSNSAKKQSYDKTRENMKIKEEKKILEDERQKKLKKNRKKRHNKKLKALERKIGEVKIEIMVKALENIKKSNDSDIITKNQCIVDLYQKQQKFSKEIVELDDDLDGDDLSDLSDLDC